MKKDKLGLRLYNVGMNKAHENQIEMKSLNVGFDNTIWAVSFFLFIGVCILAISLLIFLMLLSMPETTSFISSRLYIGPFDFSHEDRFICIPFVFIGLIITLYSVMLLRKGEKKKAERIELVYNHLIENQNRGFIDIATISQKLIIQPAHVKGAIQLIILSGEITGYIKDERFYFGIEGETPHSQPQMPAAHYAPQPQAAPPPPPESLKLAPEFAELLERTIRLMVPDFMDPDTTAQVTVNFKNDTEHSFRDITVDTSDLSNFFTVEGEISIPLLKPGMELDNYIKIRPKHPRGTFPVRIVIRCGGAEIPRDFTIKVGGTEIY